MTFIVVPGRGRERGYAEALPSLSAASALVVLGLDDLLAAVVAARADVKTQMRFAGGRLDGQRRIAHRRYSVFAERQRKCLAC